MTIIKRRVEMVVVKESAEEKEMILGQTKTHLLLRTTRDGQKNITNTVYVISFVLFPLLFLSYSLVARYTLTPYDVAYCFIS